MHVYLMRHGEASNFAPDGTHNDEARELTPAGTDRLRAACAVYAKMIGKPTKVMHSPLRRAQQSAEILIDATLPADARNGDTIVELGELRPSGRASLVIDLLQAEFLNGAESVVLVGHEPLLGDLVGVLTSGNDRSSVPMGTGMLAAVRLAEPQVMIGRLVAMVSQANALRMK